jgi:hypothetical protein
MSRNVRANIANFTLIDLVEVVEHIRKLCSESMSLLCGEIQPGELPEVRNVVV